MQNHVRNVDRRWSNVFKLLLQLKEAVLDFLFNVLIEYLLSANELWILGVRCLLHNSALRTSHCLVELVDAFVGKWHAFVLLDLYLGLRVDTVDRGSRRVHCMLDVKVLPWTTSEG
jgi:hypothetical protein